MPDRQHLIQVRAVGDLLVMSCDNCDEDIAKEKWGVSMNRLNDISRKHKKQQRFERSEARRNG
jgi:hypothetical protein